MKKWFIQAILYGSITITIPDAKDAIVVQARDYYNTRNGTSLTTTAFVKEMARVGIVNEYALNAQTSAQATVTASDAANKAAAAAAQAAAQAVITTQGTGW